MKFSFFAEDYKVSEEEVKERHKDDQIEGVLTGLMYDMMLDTGIETGTDSTYYFLSDQETNKETATKLIQAVEQDLFLMENQEDYDEEEWQEIKKGFVLGTYQEREMHKFKEYVLTMKDGAVHTFISLKEPVL